MSTLRASRILEIIPKTQSYDWGKPSSSSLVSAFSHPSQPAPSADKPYAELWMGTHPSLPSLVLSNGKPLSDYLASHPNLIGDAVRSKYASSGAEKGEMPFLFKVLSIAKALSIQAHPDKKLGEKLHRDRPDVYKDPNHKPEMAIALTEFEGFCGFRPLGEIVKFLDEVEEFRAVVKDERREALQKAVKDAGEKLAQQTEAEGDQAKREACQKALRDVFEDVMTADSQLVKSSLEKLVQRSKNGKGEAWQELVVTLDKQYPGGDVGIFCTFLLNIVKLSPGEAMFLQANEPHAYLNGDIMECMATSDNVVRAGLTPKLRDVPTLLSMLTYRYGPSSTQLLRPTPFRTSNTSYTTLYDPPIAEFSVLRTHLPAGASDTHEKIDGPSIVIVTEGAEGKEWEWGSEEEWEGPKIWVGKGEAEGDVKVCRNGQTWFVGAGEEVKFEAGKGKKGNVTFFRAFVEA